MYLGFMFNSYGQDDEDMLRQMRNLYIRSNKQVIKKCLATTTIIYRDIKH